VTYSIPSLITLHFYLKPGQVNSRQVWSLPIIFFINFFIIFVVFFLPGGCPSTHCCWGHPTRLLGSHRSCNSLVISSRGCPSFHRYWRRLKNLPMGGQGGHHLLAGPHRGCPSIHSWWGCPNCLLGGHRSRTIVPGPSTQPDPSTAQGLFISSGHFTVNKQPQWSLHLLVLTGFFSGE
jgi:hypothetical protein